MAWPLTASLESLALDFATAQTQDYGHGVLFQGADAAQLRGLRDLYRSGNYQSLGVLGLPVDESGKSYLLYLRDALPFENSSGLVRN